MVVSALAANHKSLPDAVPGAESAIVTDNRFDVELLTITSSTAVCASHKTNQQDAAPEDVALGQGCNTRLCIVHNINLQQFQQRMLNAPAATF